MTRRILISGAFLVTLAACGSPDTTFDFGLDAGPLENMKAGIWVDPNGCDHWIIDDGVEGYMSPRRDPKTGKPKCRDIENISENTIGFETKAIGDS